MARAFPFLRADQVELSGYDLVAHVRSGIHSPEDLFDELAIKLEFPSYFGRNRNALDECLSDLDWLSARRMALLHDAAPHLPREELVIYLSILANSVTAHSEGGRLLTIAFSEPTRALLDAWSGV